MGLFVLSQLSKWEETQKTAKEIQFSVNMTLFIVLNEALCGNTAQLSARSLSLKWTMT